MNLNIVFITKCLRAQIDSKVLEGVFSCLLTIDNIHCCIEIMSILHTQTTAANVIHKTTQTVQEYLIIIKTAQLVCRVSFFVVQECYGQSKKNGARNATSVQYCSATTARQNPM